MNQIKPPIGIRPRWIIDEKRTREIEAGVKRYLEADFPIPDEWLDELYELRMREYNRKNESKP